MLRQCVVMVKPTVWAIGDDEGDVLLSTKPNADRLACGEVGNAAVE